MINLTGLRSPCEQTEETALSQNHAPRPRLRNIVLGWPGNLAEPLPICETHLPQRVPPEDHSLLLGARELGLQSRFCQVVAMQLYRGANPSEHRYPDVKNGANTGQRGRLKRWEGLQETEKEPPSSIKGHGVLRQGCLSDPFVRSLCRGWWLSSFNSRQAAFDHPSH